MTVCEARSVQHAADIAVLVQAGRSVPGHVSAGVAGVVQGPDLGGDLIGAIGVVRLPDGVVALDPGAHRGRGGSLLLPGGSLVYLLFCVTKWGWGFDKYVAEANKGEGLKFAKWLKPYFQFILPALIVVIFLQGLL